MKRTLRHTLGIKKKLTLAHNESGSVAIIFALILTALCGFVALAVDVGHVVMVKAELQRTVDAAALAGVTGFLPYTNPGAGTQTPNWVQGQQKAHTLINNAANEADSYNFSLTDGTVTYGYWFLQPAAGYVQLPLASVPTPAANLPEPAINVSLTRNVNLYFAPIIGVSSPMSVTASATAILPASYQDTNIPPIAMDYNTVYTNVKGTVTVDVLDQDIKIQSNKGIAGWFNLDGGNSVPSVRIDTPLLSGTTAGTQIYLSPGTKATLTDYMTNGETIVVPVVNDVSQKIWQGIVGWAAFQIDPDGLSSNSITGHFVDQYFDPHVNPVAATDGIISDGAGTPYLVAP
jgi:Flp pilus assembly protein TadG